ncbi:MAG: hypothetical protein HY210_06325 [Candidatus Omnitrophica bacterium]|nr:hypothetical protein [Candidatus Omnitrophota bacterium]
MSQFNKEDILRLFHLLNDQMRGESLEGEVYLVGGAVMCLVFNARPATKDVDAFFKPAQKIREAAAKVAAQTGIQPDWLNDAVKGFFSAQGEYDAFLDLSHLRVFVARAEYLLAMKCLAMRIGEEFQDVDDIQYLVRFLNLKTYPETLGIIIRYYPLERFPQKTLYALEEIFQEKTKP